MIYSVTNDDQEEQDTITRLRDPEIYIDEGCDQELMKEAMNKEMEDMKLHDVYEEVSVDGLPSETIRDAIDTRWVHKYKTPGSVIYVLPSTLWLKDAGYGCIVKWRE